MRVTPVPERTVPEGQRGVPLWLALGAVAVEVRTDDGALLEALGGLSWPEVPGGAAEVVGAVALQACSASQLAREATTRRRAAHDVLAIRSDEVATGPLLLLLGESEATYLVPDCGLVTAPLDWSTVDVRLVPAAATTPQALELVAVVCQDLAAHNGYYALHASMAERNGRGVLFCGERARGKSTSCLALGRAGWLVRCDDRCYIRPHPRPLTVWGPACDMRLRPDVREIWPDMAETLEGGRDWGGKRLLALSALVPHWAPGHARPAALFLPEVGGGPQHRVEGLSPAVALHELLAASGIATFPAHTTAHFAAVADLVESAPCYRLQLGPDMPALPQLVEELLR